MFPPKHLDNFARCLGGCSEVLDAFRFFIKQMPCPVLFCLFLFRWRCRFFGVLCTIVISFLMESELHIFHGLEF